MIIIHIILSRSMVGQEDMKILMEAGWPTSNIYNVAELCRITEHH